MLKLKRKQCAKCFKTFYKFKSITDEWRDPEGFLETVTTKCCPHCGSTDFITV